MTRSKVSIIEQLKMTMNRERNDSHNYLVLEHKRIA